MLIYEFIFSPIVVVGAVLLFVSFRFGNKEPFKKELFLLSICLSPVLFSLISYLFFIPKQPDFWDDIILSCSFVFSYGIIRHIKRQINVEVFEYLSLLFLASIPFLVISPFWNISGHVLFSTIPVFFLIIKRKASLFLTLIPIIMVYNRPILNEHTWFQSVFTFFFSILLISIWFIKIRKTNIFHIRR